MEELNNEEIYENLVAMYNKLNLNLIEEGREKTVKIQDIRYIGNVELEEKLEDSEEYRNILKEVYVVEEYEPKSDKLIIKYYLDDMCLGTEFGEQIIETEDCKRRFKSIDSIRDLIDNIKYNELMPQQKVKSLNELEEERLEKIAKALGIDKKELADISEFDLDKEEKQEDNEKQEDDKKINDTKNKIHTKESTDLDQIYEGRTLRNVLGLSGEYARIAIVSSSEVKGNEENKQNGKYCFVGIKYDGDVTVLDETILGPDNQEGTDPRKMDTTVDIDGTVDKEQNIASYKVMGRNNLYLSIGYDESHGKEIKIAKRERQGTEDLEFELLTNRHGYYQEDASAGEFRKDRSEGINKVDNALNKENIHENDEEINVQDIDSNKQNDTHYHIIVDGKEVTYKELATKWGYYDNGKPDEKKAKEMFEKFKYNNPHLSDELIIREVSDYLYDQLPGLENRS